MSTQSETCRHLAFLALVLLLALPQAAHSLSYVMVSDDKLFDDAELIVRATVIDPVDMSAGRVPGQQRQYSDYALRIERVYKGQPLTSVIFLRVLGAPPGEPGFHVFGAPRFMAGEETLLFLRRHSDQLWRLTHFHMGAFRILEFNNQAVLDRSMSGTHNQLKGANSEFYRPRDLLAFENWLETRAAGLAFTADYFADLSIVERDLLKFTLLRAGDGEGFRFFRFDSSDPAFVFDTENGQPDMNTDERIITHRALGAWTNDSESGVRLRYGGSIALEDAPRAFPDRCGSPSTADPRTPVFWDDPDDELSNFGGCGGSGTLAIGGPACAFGPATTIGDEEYFNTIRGRVVVASGTGCFFDGNNGANGAEVMTHEFGHVLGLGHSCGDSDSPSCGSDATLNEATMRAQAHGDGRGAEIKPDDQDGIRFIYPESGAPYQLAIYPTGPGTGTVTASGTEIDCGDVCDDLVARNTSVTLTATPASGSSFVGWSGDCPSTSSSNISVTMDQGRFCLAEFDDSPAVTYTVSTNATGPGSIDPTSQTVVEGNTAEFTMNPDEGAQLNGATGCNGSLDGTTYTTGAITSSCTVSANFSLMSYSVSTQVSGPGSIDPTSASVQHGSSTSFELIPDTGAEIVSASGCGGSLSGSTYTTGSITGACTVSAEFALLEYTVSTSVSGPGSISPSSAQVTHGETTEFTLSADSGAAIGSVSGCGGSLSGNTYTTGAITGTCTVSATFVDDPDVIFRDRFEE